jgi:hypothetical protein
MTALKLDRPEWIDIGPFWRSESTALHDPSDWSLISKRLLVKRIDLADGAATVGFL